MDTQQNPDVTGGSRGNIAIVGGSGFEVLPDDIFAEEVQAVTSRGTFTALSISHNYVEPYSLYFVSRHGALHETAPHAIDYRVQMQGLHALHVTHVLATWAVGALHTDLPVGALLVPDDFIDAGHSAHAAGAGVSHVDFTRPYSDECRRALLDGAAALNVPIRDGGVYLGRPGPRYETPAEVRVYASWGADVVGMTGVPEAVAAREAGLHYAGIAIVTNMAAGLAAGGINHMSVTATAGDAANSIRETLFRAAAIIAESSRTGN